MYRFPQAQTPEVETKDYQELTRMPAMKTHFKYSCLSEFIRRQRYSTAGRFVFDCLGHHCDSNGIALQGMT